MLMKDKSTALLRLLVKLVLTESGKDHQVIRTWSGFIGGRFIKMAAGVTPAAL